MFYTHLLNLSCPTPIITPSYLLGKNLDIFFYQIDILFHPHLLMDHINQFEIYYFLIY